MDVSVTNAGAITMLRLVKAANQLMVTARPNRAAKKLCPFDPDSPMCDPSSACYFWTTETGGQTYMCPTAACDDMIISHCTSLGYTHPSEKRVAIPELTKLDLGCAPLVRLGIAPFSDWVQPYDTPATTSTASAWPAKWTTRAPDGAGSHYQVMYTLSSSPDLSQFRANLATALAIDQYYIKDLTVSGTTVTVKVYTAETGAVASKIASWASYQGSTALSSYTFTSTPVSSWKKVSNSCYCASPPSDCGAGYDAGSCLPDTVSQGFTTSTSARSGIASVPASDFSNTGDWIVGGIYVATILFASLGIIYFIFTAAC